MASFFTNKALTELANGGLDLDTNTLKVMLLRETLVPTKAMDVVSEINTHELSVTGYTGGFGGAGRKTLTGVTVVEDDTNNRARVTLPDQTWTALGSGQSIAYAAIIREGTADTDSLIVAFIDVTNAGTPVATNGGDVTLDFDASAPLYIAA